MNGEGEEKEFNQSEIFFPYVQSAAKLIPARIKVPLPPVHMYSSQGCHIEGSLREGSFANFLSDRQRQGSQSTGLRVEPDETTNPRRNEQKGALLLSAKSILSHPVLCSGPTLKLTLPRLRRRMFFQPLSAVKHVIIISSHTAIKFSINTRT